MDLVISKRHLLHVPQALSPSTSLGASNSQYCSRLHPSTNDFPMIGIILMGLIATSFLLVSYYIIVVKCCLNLHHADLARRFSLSMLRDDEPTAMPSSVSESRGLDEAVIRSIPVIQYKKTEEEKVDFGGERSICCDCAVCLNEFQQDEKLRIIPNCSHVFHIDCIDVWLQNNVNCPLCRTSISLTSGSPVVDQVLSTPRPSPLDQSPNAENLGANDEEFSVIELGTIITDQNLHTCPITSPSASKLEQRILQKKARELDKVTSMGEECSDTRGKNGHFSVQPLRRSFSMDSSGNREFYLAVQEEFQQQNNGHHVIEVSSIEVCGGGSGRAKRSFFSFGHGSSRFRSAVLPVNLDP